MTKEFQSLGVEPNVNAARVESLVSWLDDPEVFRIFWID
ncbi:hypothetical protein P243_0826 [Klebsiella pneumoniae subsp. pneumoniae 1158]|nr:hypothetical protein P243_0826 [Klebsiella pneumoniae subsp. pneumoniae 1158]